MIAAAKILDASILIIDDQEANVLLLSQMLTSAGYTSITVTQDPLSVWDLHRRNHFDLILLDLMMPGMDGFQVMEGLKDIEPDGYLPVLVVTAEPGHRLRALQAGAKDFLAKPFDFAEVLARVHNLLEVRLLHKALQSHNDVLEERVRERTLELREGYLEAIFSMVRAAEHKDELTGAHVQRIGHYCRALARMLGQGEDFVDKIFFASPMHDVGKIGIPDSILLKPGPLTVEEWVIMKTHTTMGATILGNNKSPFLKMGAEIALNHHERWDGGGYPNGIRGKVIPLAARIMNLCDIYDALRSERPYKPAFDHEKTMEVISRGDGRVRPVQFDPDILSAFATNHDAFRDIYETFT